MLRFQSIATGVAFVFAWTSLFACSGLSALAAEAGIAPGNQLKMFLEKVEKKQIKVVEIIGIDPGSLTQTRMESSILQANYDFKFEMRSISETKTGGRFLDALRSTIVESTDQAADLRWGIIFRGPKDNKVGTIFMSGGDLGEINGIKVKMNGGIKDWLASQLKGIFQ